MINSPKLNIFERFDLLPTYLDLSSYLFREDLNLFPVEDKDLSKSFLLTWSISVALSISLKKLLSDTTTSC